MADWRDRFVDGEMSHEESQAADEAPKGVEPLAALEMAVLARELRLPVPGGMGRDFRIGCT